MFTCPTLQEYECDWHFLSRDQSHVYEIDVQSPGRLVLDQCGSPSPVAMQLFRRLTTATTATPTSSPPAAASAGPELAWELVRGFDDERCTDTNKPTHVTWWLDPGQHALVIDSTAATANTTGGAASYSVTLSAAASPARGGPTAHCHPPMHACPTAHAAWTDPHGLGLSTATLGRIDALSANATADTAMMAGFVQERSALNVFNKWSGAAFAPATGKLYSPPRDAESVLIINPQTDTADNTTMAGFESTARRSGGKWRSIAYSPSTQRLYAAPCDENAVLIINPISNTTDVTAMAGLGEATDKWSSIAYAPSIGKLFAAPADADAVLVIDPMTNKTDVSDSMPSIGLAIPNAMSVTAMVTLSSKPGRTAAPLHWSWGCPPMQPHSRTLTVPRVQGTLTAATSGCRPAVNRQGVSISTSMETSTSTARPASPSAVRPPYSTPTCLDLTTGPLNYLLCIRILTASSGLPRNLHLLSHLLCEPFCSGSVVPP